MSIIKVIFDGKKRLIVYKCDQCNKEYKGKYQKKFLTSRRHTYCSHECLGKSKKVGGIDYENIQKSRDNESWKNKVKQTVIKKYGVENVSSLEFVKKKKAETTLKNYGVDNPLKSKLVRQKCKLTLIDRYGVDNPSKSTEIKEKSKKTCLDRYDVENPFQAECFKKKSRETTLRNYGVEHSMQSDVVKEKAKKTWIKNYGVDHPWKSEEIRKKTKETWIKNYGDHPSRIIEIMNKRRSTNQKKYGVDHPLKSDIVKSKIDYKALWKKSHETMKKNGTYGKSKIEDRFYKFVCEKFGKDNIERQVRINEWIIDFHIKPINTYIQFDGIYWHGLDRPIEIIKESERPRDKVIYQTFLRDLEQNKWFKENEIKLIRIFDEIFRKDVKKVEELLSLLA